MSKKLLAVNVVLAGLAAVFAVWLMRDLAATRPLPAPPAARRAAPPAAEEPAPDGNAQDKLAGYNVIVSKYLFNPSRTEGAPAEAQKPPAAPLPPKPVLLGVVVDGTTSRAYLEDPATKRVFGYQVGDSVAGGKLEKITDDRIQISRSDGLIDVTLRDPTKPRPAAPVAAAPPGAAPATPPGAVPPGTPTAGPENPAAPARPPIPPRSLRRMPPDQQQQQQQQPPASQ